MTYNKGITIAIDGYSSCGKSTMAKDLARDLGYIYVDTGAMYRAVTLYTIRHHLWMSDGCLDEQKLREAMPTMQIAFRRDPESGMPRVALDGEDVESEVRTMVVSQRVSPVAALDFVREALVQQQQQMGQGGGVVMDGRDVGTTILPKAELKIFVTARPEVRARRRYDELRQKGDAAITVEEVLANLTERDQIDSTREISPLRQADDAILFDNSDMTIEEQRAHLLQMARECIVVDTK